MILTLKIALVILCTLIAFQDFKDRMVSWILFPLVGIALGLLYLENSTFEQWYPFVITNIVLVSLIVLMLFLYARNVARMKFLNVSFGLGDLLFFYALTFGFPTATFLILFVLSILFSLITTILMNWKKGNQTVPLAGLMGLFVIGILLASFFPNVPSLYIL